MSQLQTREFDLGDVLSITTSRLVSPRMMEGVHDILDFIFGSAFMTHELPPVSRRASSVILQQHPQLAECDADGVDATTWQGWLAEQKVRFGERLPIRQAAEPSSDSLHAEGWTYLLENIGKGGTE